MNMKVFLKWWNTTHKLENKMLTIVDTIEYEVTVEMFSFIRMYNQEDLI